MEWGVIDVHGASTSMCWSTYSPDPLIYCKYEFIIYVTTIDVNI